MYTLLDEFECLDLSLVAFTKQRKPIFDWDIVVRKRLDVDGYSQFISSYMDIAYKIIHGVSPPRLIPHKK